MGNPARSAAARPSRRKPGAVNRKDDTSGAGKTGRRWYQRPATVSVAAALTVLMAAAGAAFGYGQVAARTLQNAERIERIEERIEKQLAAINRKLDSLFQPRAGGLE